MVFYLDGMYQILIIDHTPTYNDVKEYSKLEELDRVPNQSIIKILRCPVKSQNKPFVDPVDEDKVQGTDQIQNGQPCGKCECDPGACHQLCKPRVHDNLWADVELLIIPLLKLATFVPVASLSIIDSPSMVVGHQEHGKDVRHEDFKDHGQNDLITRVKIPLGSKLGVLVHIFEVEDRPEVISYNLWRLHRDEHENES